jgi:hypothetical protein
MHTVNLCVYGHPGQHSGQRFITFTGPVFFEDNPNALFDALCAIEPWKKWDQMWDNVPQNMVYDRDEIRRLNKVQATQKCKSKLQLFQNALVSRHRDCELYINIYDEEKSAAELRYARENPQLRPADRSLSSLLACLNNP